jgi:FMN phosphatase YigB (HAD superfamily)
VERGFAGKSYCEKFSRNSRKEVRMKRIKSARGGSASGGKLIIFDLDDTLINTDQIRRNIVKFAQDLGVSKKMALRARGQVRSSSQPFTIENYGKLLFSNDTDKRKMLAEKFYSMFEKRGEFNYPGIERFLKGLKNKYSLVLLTYGDKDLQKKKINQSGLDKFFSEAIVSRDNTKVAPLIHLQKKHGNNILFIDNAKTTCDAACELGIPMIWVTSARKSEGYFKKLAERINKRMS